MDRHFAGHCPPPTPQSITLPRDRVKAPTFRRPRMPYDEDLAARVRELFERRKGVVEKKLFGGVGWMLNGNLCVGVWKDSLIARVGAGDTDAALAEPHTRP